MPIDNPIKISSRKTCLYCGKFSLDKYCDSLCESKANRIKYKEIDDTKTEFAKLLEQNTTYVEASGIINTEDYEQCESCKRFITQDSIPSFLYFPDKPVICNSCILEYHKPRIGSPNSIFPSLANGRI